MFKNFSLVAIVFALSLGILYSTIMHLDPFGTQQSIAYFALFFGAFSAIWAFFTVFFFFGNELLKGYKLGSNQFVIASRRAAWVAALAVCLGILQILRLLGLEEILLLSIFFVLLEWIFMTNRGQYN